MKKVTGFTLVELVAVILIIGVLSVTAYPLLSDRGGFSEVTYQARLVSALRNMQLRAMQDSRANYCFHINLSANGASQPGFGAPTLDYADGNQSTTCSTNIDYTLSAQDSSTYTTQTEMAEAGVDLDAQDFLFSPFTNRISTIGFNDLGQPVRANNGALMCTGTCRITLTGERTRYVCVAPQGYVYPSASPC